MKVFLIILFSLLFSMSAFTQVTYSNSYDIDETKDNGQRIFKKDSLVFTVSNSFCSDTGSGIDCTGILCTNLAGEEVWKMVIDSMEFTYLNTTTMTEDHLYLALQSHTESYQGMRIFKVDFFGNIVESADIIQEDDFLVYGIHKVEDGFKLYVGKSGEGIEIYGALLYLNESYEEVMETRYTFMDMIEIHPVSIVELGDEGSNIIISYTGTDELIRRTIIRIDTNGNVLWTYPMVGENTPTGNNLSIFHLPSEGFFVTFQVGYLTQPIVNPRRLKMAKFTELGELIWSREIGLFSSNVVITKPFLTVNNELVGLGLLQIPDSIGSSVTYDFQGYISRFDLEGNVLWERTIIEEQFSTVGFYFNFLISGLELDNGDLLFCGSVTDEDDLNSTSSPNIWLVRTTPEGCLDLDDCENLTPVEEVAIEDQVNFVLYPNPANFYITIDIDNLQNPGDWNARVLNASGQLQSLVQMNQFPYQLKTENLIAGLYFLELTNKEGVRKMLKFVRQ